MGKVMRDRSDRYRVQTSAVEVPKRLGNYLVEAGLLTTDQISVILTDQQSTGMRFGDIIVARGWLKEQTIEWVIEKVVEPDRQLHQHPTPDRRSLVVKSIPQPEALRSSTSASSSTASSAPTKPFMRRDIPISKPLPSVSSSDGDVNWVG